MIFDRLFDVPVVAALKKGLEGAAVRHRAIANNIANVSTPGYKRQVVRFEQELWKALERDSAGLKTSHPKHLGGGSRMISEVRPTVMLDEKSVLRVDQNTVNIDQEMVELAKNSSQYAERAEILKRLYGQIKAAIRGQVR